MEKINLSSKDKKEIDNMLLEIMNKNLKIVKHGDREHITGFGKVIKEISKKLTKPKPNTTMPISEMAEIKPKFDVYTFNY